LSAHPRRGVAFHVSGKRIRPSSARERPQVGHRRRVLSADEALAVEDPDSGGCP
jgi:hypothetical protein